jgi:hypothetical protein
MIWNNGHKRFQAADFAEAGLTRSAQGHDSDQHLLDCGLRLECALEGGEEGGELAGVLRVGEKRPERTPRRRLLREELPRAVTGPPDLAGSARCER